MRERRNITCFTADSGFARRKNLAPFEGIPCQVRDKNLILVSVLPLDLESLLRKCNPRMDSYSRKHEPTGYDSTTRNIVKYAESTQETASSEVNFYALQLRF